MFFGPHNLSLRSLSLGTLLLMCTTTPAPVELEHKYRLLAPDDTAALAAFTGTLKPFKATETCTDTYYDTPENTFVLNDVQVRLREIKG